MNPFESVFLSEMILSNSGRKASGLFSIVAGRFMIVSYSVSIYEDEKSVIIAAKPYTNILIYCKTDLDLTKKIQYYSFYPIIYSIMSQKFINVNPNHIKDNSQLTGIITNEGAFILLKLENPQIGLCSSTEIHRINPPDDRFSCFQPYKDMVNQSLRIFAGSHSGRIYIYDITLQPRLLRVINANSNFYIKSLQLYEFNKQPNSSPQPFISIATLDGHIKIFNQRDPEPLYEFVGAKKPVFDLHWDSNPSLVFFLDESDTKAVNVISFNRNPAVADYAKKLIKNPVSLIHLTMDQYSDHFACYCEDGTVRVGIISVS